MVIRIEEIQSACSKILAAVDSNSVSALTETLQLTTRGKELFLNVTNNEYFAKVKLEMKEPVEFNATVNANLFLKLISQITTETIELSVTETALILKGNGTYNLPLIFDGDRLMELPEIIINNPTTSFSIDSSILQSILQFNSKELSKGIISRPIQKLYYMDELGAITFTTGACVNSFSLEKPVKVLLNDRLVKLFKLFKDGPVNFTLGYDTLADGVIQTKVRFESEDISLTAILSCDDTMLQSYPVNAVRARANSDYPYSVNISREQLIQTINRLLLFTSANGARDIINPYSTFEFKPDRVVVWDTHHENFEEVFYTNTRCEVEDAYTTMFDFKDFRTTLENCSEQYVTLNFGDEQALVVARGNVRVVIPECRV